MGLAETDPAVDKERVISLAGCICNSTGGGIGELVASADHKGVKGEFRAQEYAAACQLCPSVLLDRFDLFYCRSFFSFEDPISYGYIFLQVFLHYFGDQSGVVVLYPFLKELVRNLKDYLPILDL
ncbi:hypothetical protein BMS3Abin09_01302 [bacterium BMS3Abin09]|nr:hypothetical protein BMS3Abin09_01302 [bacterium BMS3Abin09]